MHIHINPVYAWHCGNLSTLGKIMSTTNEKDVDCPDCLAKKKQLDYGNFTPNFPLVKFANTNKIKDQLWHIDSEATEAWLDLTSQNFSHMAIEILDLIHSAETALHILATQHGIDVNEAKRKVIEKNEARGYYSLTATK